MNKWFAPNKTRFYSIGDYAVTYVVGPERCVIPNRQEELLEALRPAASRGFGHQVSIDSLRRRVVKDQDYLLLVGTEDFLAGFASARKLAGTSAIFLTGVVLSPECQGKGLGSALLHVLLEESGCPMLVCTTQSPVMYLMLMRTSKVVHPGLEGGPIPHDLQKMGARIMEGRRGEFDPTTFVAMNLYPQCLYPEFPWCSDPRVNAFFRQMLHFEGDNTKDGFLLIGEVV